MWEVAILVVGGSSLYSLEPPSRGGVTGRYDEDHHCNRQVEFS